jgi:hypothetical protein
MGFMPRLGIASGVMIVSQGSLKWEREVYGFAEMADGKRRFLTNRDFEQSKGLLQGVPDYTRSRY